MGKQIDCLIIGHNEMDFADYESGVLKMGEHTGAYKDLNLNFVRYDNRATTAAEIFNIIYYNKKDREGEFTPVTLGETFHAAISYLGTYLSRRGFSFDYINSFTDDKEELARKLEENDYMTIAITTTLYVSVFPITGIIGFIKRYNDTAKIIVGGPYVYTQHRAQERISLEYLFGPVIGADIYVISSQGEKALTDILRALKNDTPLDQVDNLCFVTPDGIQWTAISTENNPLPENMVDWSLFPGGIGEYVNIRTAISCPFKCEFCGFPEHAGDYQTAGVDVVEKELNLLSRNATLKNVHFIDDTFNVPLKRFKELLRMMIKNKYPFKWHSHFRCQYADRETLELMKESGCEGVFLGVESGSDTILKNMNKAVTVEKYFKGIQLLREFDILTYGSFIIGFPGETEETAQETIDFIPQSGLEFYRAQLWYCDTITPVWKKREQYKLKGSSFEWSHATMDSQRAAEIVDEIFMTVKGPVWVPQYNFELDSIFHLIHRGVSVPQIRNFLLGFNDAVRERVNNPSQKNISMEAIKNISRSLDDDSKN